MSNELISKRTRVLFRDYLKSWTLGEIGSAFDASNIKFDAGFEPEISGERRSFVEQHYRTLDFTKPDDVRRLLEVYATVIERADREGPRGFGVRGSNNRESDELKRALERDGFKYANGNISAVSANAQRVFQAAKAVQTISEVTRRIIFDELSVRGTAWWGRLSEPDFLGRIWNLKELPTTDGRFSDMLADIWKHRENNFDWANDWVFGDSRLNLLGGPDRKFLQFLCEMVHPAVREDAEEAATLVATFNEHLAVDGWELVPDRRMSGRPIFAARQRASFALHAKPLAEAHDVLSNEYVRELHAKCDARLQADDFEGAVTVARTLLEAVLGELELRISGTKSDYKGELTKQFKVVTKLLRMDEERSDLDDRFKEVIRGLVMIASGIAPLRNKISDSHARSRKPAPHHARVVVNAAKTVSAFLVESYLYQRDKGHLMDAAPKAAT